MALVPNRFVIIYTTKTVPKLYKNGKNTQKKLFINMESTEIINTIANKLSEYLNIQPQYYGDAQTNSKYFYINNGSKPLIILRLSDHHPNLQKFISKDDNYPYPSPGKNSNISIEFFSQRKVVGGKKIKNKFGNDVSIARCKTKPNEDFFVSSYDAKNR